MSDPLLTIRNHHSAACGDPPIIDGASPNIYIGYFENPYGEQWIFTFDRETRRAVLRGGDVGWNTQFEVVDGVAEGLLLGKQERAWLQASWSASIV